MSRRPLMWVNRQTKFAEPPEPFVVNLEMIPVSADLNSLFISGTFRQNSRKAARFWPRAYGLPAQIIKFPVFRAITGKWGRERFAADCVAHHPVAG